MSSSPAPSDRDAHVAATTESLPALLREYADRTTGYIYSDEVAALRAAAAEIDRLRAKLAEYDKYVAEFTRHA